MDMSTDDTLASAGMLSTAADDLHLADGSLEPLTGYDEVCGVWVAQALELLDAEWQRYHATLVKALNKFSENARRFANDVKTADDAARFEFDRVEHQFTDPNEYYALESTIGTEANAVDKLWTLTMPQGINEGMGAGFESLKELDLSDIDKTMINRLGGPLTLVPGLAIEYQAAIEEGYSPQTARSASVVSNAAGTVGGIAGGAIGALAGGVGAPFGLVAGSYLASTPTAAHIKRASGELVPPYRHHGLEL